MTIPESYPTVARAYKALDEVATELRDLKVAHRQLQAENAVAAHTKDAADERMVRIQELEAKLEDLKAERDNMYPLLREAGELNAKLTRELDLLVPELDRLRDNNAELDERRLELRAERDELRRECTHLENAALDADQLQARVDELTEELSKLASERDYWKIKYNAAVTR